jgi:prepilin-type N-terminal cleavage/methylation domain-containing protein
MKQRRAFTLIEMVTVMAIAAVLSGIAVFLLVSLLKNHDAGRQHLIYCRTLNRLAERFRDDVHAAQKTSTENSGEIFDLPIDSSTDAKIRYQCLPDRIDRSEIKGGQAVSVESYMLSRDMEASIKTRIEAGAEIAFILISESGQTQKISFSPPVRIEAVLGLDFRLAKVKATANKEQPATEGKP